MKLGGRIFTVKRAFLDDLNSQHQAARVRELRRPLMVLHAPGDMVVPIENAAAIFRTARRPKSFVSLGDADHLLTRASDSRFAADVIAAWAGHYLEKRSGAADVHGWAAQTAVMFGTAEAVLSSEKATTTANEQGPGAALPSVRASA